jgi:cytoskeletal protein CcmA (bactofilin family)
MTRMRGRVLSLVLFAGLAAAAGLQTPAFGQTSTGSATPSPSVSPGAIPPANPQDQIVLSGRVVVPRGQTVGEIVVFTGKVQVAGVVEGDVVVLDGPILVTGQVSGTVVAFDGSVRLGAAAQVGGDVIARESVDAAEGSAIEGTVREHAAFTLKAPVTAMGRLASWLAVSVSSLLLGLLLLLLAPRGADRIVAAARQAPWAATGWGLAVALVVPALAGLAVISLVGLPLGLVVFLALGLVAFVAYAWAMYLLGRAMVTGSGRVLAFLAGWAVARVVGLIPVVSGITFLLATVFGLGATTVAIWRARGVTPRRGGSHRRGYTPAEPAAEDVTPAAEPIG